MYYNQSPIYLEVRRFIENREFSKAESALVSIPAQDRTAEWHYLASVLLMHRGRTMDAIRELEIACNMDPTNEEYQNAKQMFNQNADNYSYGYQRDDPYRNNTRPQTSGAADACDCCARWMCMNLMCNCCMSMCCGH